MVQTSYRPHQRKRRTGNLKPQFSHDKRQLFTIYTDGSGINGRIGASAVTMFSPWPGARPLVAREKRACIGSDQQFTAYFGELYGLLMALDLVVFNNSNQKVLIFTDNQAAITSYEQLKQQSGQYLLQEIALRIESPPRQLEIHWIPAHSGVPGNELADIAAKEATGWRATGPPSTPSHTPPNLPTLTSAYKTAARYRANEQWAENWKTEKHGRTTFKLTPEPSAFVLHKFNTMSRAESSVIVQARTGKIGLRSYLHLIGAENSRNCPCGEGAQSVQHILLCCPEFEELRETMWKHDAKRT